MVGREVSWGEAVDLVDELRRDTTSHVYAAEARWAWVPAGGETKLTSLLEWYMNAHRDTDTHPALYELPQPWQVSDPVVEVTFEERAELKQRLLRRSAFRDR